MLDVSSYSNLFLGCVASLFAGSATAIGSLGVFFFKDNVSKSLENKLLSFAAGVMLAASFFSLIIPAIESGVNIYSNKVIAIFVVIIGILIGAIVIFIADKYFPSNYFVGFLNTEPGDVQSSKKVWMFIIAVIVHNFPEGMAVGVSFFTENITTALALTNGIAIQNIPEGFAVSLSLISLRYSKFMSFLIGAFSGIAEPIGGCMAALLVFMMRPILPLCLSIAAGCMIYVICHEVIPEIQSSKKRSPVCTFYLFYGLLLMMFFDMYFG